MIHGLNVYEKLNVIRPDLENHKLDSFQMPVIKRITEENLKLENVGAMNLRSLSCKNNNSDKIALSFNFDKELNRYWNNPLKYIPVLQTVKAVCTPDFSLYSSMNFNEIAHNVYKNRWIGCFWQEYGITVLPTISWASKDTFDISFSGYEGKGIVVISTLGCHNFQNEFLAGFNEMKKRLSPSLIIVFGNFISGMSGRFINYKYEDLFFKKQNHIIQPELFEFSRIFEIKEA